MKISLLTILIIFVSCLMAQTIEETLTQIQATKAELIQNEVIVNQKIAELRKSNPLFAPKGNFESDTEYIGRMSKANPQLDAIRKQFLGDVESRLAKLRNRAFETSNISVTLNKYEPNTQIYDITVEHLAFQKEVFNIKWSIEREKAKEINTSWDKIVKKGKLTIDFGDSVGLAKLILENPISGNTFEYEFQPMWEIPLSSVSLIDFSPNIKYVVAKGVSESQTEEDYDSQDDKKIYLFNLDTKQKAFEFDIGNYNTVSCLSFNTDGRLIAIGASNDPNKITNGVIIYNLSTKQPIADFLQGQNVSSVAFSPDNKFLAVGSYEYFGQNNKVQVFNLNTMQQILEFDEDNSHTVNSVAFSPDGHLLAIGTSIDYKNTNGVIIYNLSTKQPIADFWQGQTVNSVAFSPDGNFLAAGVGRKSYGGQQKDFQALIFDIETFQQVAEFSHDEAVTSVSFSQNSKFLVTGCVDNKARIFDFTTKQLVAEFDGGNSVALSPDCKYIAVNKMIYRTFLTTNQSADNIVISKPPKLTASVTFNEPSKNSYLDALEKGKIIISIKNDGQGDGKGISIKLAPAQIKGLFYNNSFISEILVGKTASIDIPIEAYIDVTDSTHTLTISFEEQNGFPPNPCELQFSTKAYQKPVLVISDVGIEDSNANGKIESGEMVNLTIRVTNQGVGDASGAYAKFYSGENVFLTDKYSQTQALGDLKPNQTKDVNLEFFVNDRCVNEIPLYVDFTEATGLATVNKLRVPITKTDIARPISRTVVTGIESDNAKSNEPDLNIDIEKTIPNTLNFKTDTYAVILGLETYSSSIPMVRFAARDAAWFREYAFMTLGIPQSNIYYRTNDQITKNEFDKVFGIGGWLDKRIIAGKSEVIFYYAGHGVPAKDNKAYLVPYDGDPNYATLTCYPVEQIYNSLNRMNLKHSLVILDACFTGMNRDNQPLFADARPLYIKTELPSGFPNLSIMAGAGSDQMSNAYPEKKHGLFSYFLMKGMQGSADTNQDKKLTLKELGDYVKTEVSRQAGYLDKEQTPELSTSVPDMVLIEY